MIRTRCGSESFSSAQEHSRTQPTGGGRVSNWPPQHRHLLSLAHFFRCHSGSIVPTPLLGLVKSLAWCWYQRAPEPGCNLNAAISGLEECGLVLTYLDRINTVASSQTSGPPAASTQGCKRLLLLRPCSLCLWFLCGSSLRYKKSDG